MMADKYISAEALTLSLRDDYELTASSFARVKRHIEAAPDMVKRGRWKMCEDEHMICATEFTCSNCNETFCNSEMDDKEYLALMKYCPNCGAKMDVGE